MGGFWQDEFRESELGDHLDGKEKKNVQLVLLG